MEIVSTPPLEPVLPTYRVKRFSADQYVEMIRTEILTKEDRVELIDGVITEMAPAGEEHTWEVILLNDLFAEARSTHFLAVQSTVPIGPKDVYDPDFFLIRRGGPEQQRQYPKTEDIDLVVEVAKASLQKDRTSKAAAYAAAGIPEYWIVDLNSRTLLVHRSPAEEGYEAATALQVGESISPLALPSIVVKVSDLFVG